MKQIARIIGFGLVLLFSSPTQAQPESGKGILIFLDVIDKQIYFKIGIDTIVDVRDNTFIIVDLADSLGSMEVTAYKDNSFREMKLSGKYLGVPEIMKSRLIVLDPETRYKKYEPFTYHHPLRNGAWNYYTDDGKIWVTYFWDNGKLMEIKKQELTNY